MLLFREGAGLIEETCWRDFSKMNCFDQVAIVVDVGRLADGKQEGKQETFIFKEMRAL